MRVVFLHGHNEDVRRIQERLTALDPKRAEQVLFTSRPAAMCDAVKAAEKSGGVFVVATWGGICLRSGNAVPQAKNASRSSMFFAYLGFGDASHLHGVIPRDEDHTLVARVLAFVAEAEGKVTIEHLAEAFPDITSNLQSVK